MEMTEKVNIHSQSWGPGESSAAGMSTHSFTNEDHGWDSWHVTPLEEQQGQYQWTPEVGCQDTQYETNKQQGWSPWHVTQWEDQQEHSQWYPEMGC